MSSNCHFARSGERMGELRVKGAIIVRASGLAGKCPLQYYKKFFDPKEMDARGYAVTSMGTESHKNDEEAQEGARLIINQEKYYLIKFQDPRPEPELKRIWKWEKAVNVVRVTGIAGHGIKNSRMLKIIMSQLRMSIARGKTLDRSFYVKGEMDKLRIHPVIGYFVEDLKTKEKLDASECYKLMKQAEELKYGWESYEKQLSVYAFLEYVYNKRRVRLARIRFLRRDKEEEYEDGDLVIDLREKVKLLRELSEGIILWHWRETQTFIETHPTVQALVQDDVNIAIQAARDLELDKNKFPCSWCDYKPCEVFGNRPKPVKKPPRRKIVIKKLVGEKDLEGL